MELRMASHIFEGRMRILRNLASLDLTVTGDTEGEIATPSFHVTYKFLSDQNRLTFSVLGNSLPQQTHIKEKLLQWFG